MGWVAEIWKDSGMELLTNRDGHKVQDLVLFSADGKVLMTPFPPLLEPGKLAWQYVARADVGRRSKTGAFHRQIGRAATSGGTE
jgi:hypothetical protein